MKCPHCTNSDVTLIEKLTTIGNVVVYLCGICSRKFMVSK